MAQKGCIGKDSKPNRGLLKELAPPSHPITMPLCIQKAVTDHLVDILKQYTEPRTYKAQQPHPEGTTPGA